VRSGLILARPKIHKMEQRTPEWHEARCGKITASPISNLLQSPTSAGYDDYITDLVYERMTGKPVQGFSGFWTKRGQRLEEPALVDFERRNFQVVQRVGFVERVDLMAGCSPDGLIWKDGIIQVKCPKHTTLINYHLQSDSFDISRDVGWAYYCQMQFEMYITGRKYNIFWVWHPYLEPFERRLEPDKALFKRFPKVIKAANILIEDRIRKLS